MGAGELILSVVGASSWFRVASCTAAAGTKGCGGRGQASVGEGELCGILCCSPPFLNEVSAGHQDWGFRATEKG